jgi:hypothetical protein
MPTTLLDVAGQIAVRKRREILGLEEINLLVIGENCRCLLVNYAEAHLRVEHIGEDDLNRSIFAEVYELQEQLTHEYRDADEAERENIVSAALFLSTGLPIAGPALFNCSADAQMTAEAIEFIQNTCCRVRNGEPVAIAIVTLSAFVDSLGCQQLRAAA